MHYLIIIFIIGILILVHEIGHLIAGRIMKIPIAVFSIGFGPKLVSRKIGETEFRLSWIPLGGYILPALESESEYFKIPMRRRVVFALGGPLANLLLPVLLFSVVNIIQGGMSWAGLFIHPWSQMVLQVNHIILSIPLLFSHPGQLSGIVGIVAQGADIISADMGKTLLLTIMLSLNLAVLNLLPIPGLDGGKIILCLFEKIHPGAPRWQIPVTLAGLLLLVGVIIYATVLDIQKLFT